MVEKKRDKTLEEEVDKLPTSPELERKNAIPVKSRKNHTVMEEKKNRILKGDNNSNSNNSQERDRTSRGRKSHKSKGESWVIWCGGGGIAGPRRWVCPLS